MQENLLALPKNSKCMFYRTSFHSSKPNFVLKKESTLTCIHALKSGTNLFSKSLNNRKK